MGHPKLSVFRTLQSGGWQAPQRLHRWTQDRWGLWPTPANASSCPLPGLLRLAAPQKTKCTQYQPVCLSSPSEAPTGAFCFQGHLWPLLLRCVRAWGLRSRCLAQIHILFLSLCNNQCSWRSWAELEPGEEEAGATFSWKPWAWSCCCDHHTPSRCTVSMM